MDYFDVICWEFVEETAKESLCKMSYEEKCSAAGLGMAYGLAIYESNCGNQHCFLKECMEQAITLAYKKNNAHRKIESTYSLDKEMIYEGSIINGHSFFDDKKVNIEDSVTLKEFEDKLLYDESKVLKLIFEGFELQEIAFKLQSPLQYIEGLAEQIKQKYREYCI